MATRTEIRQAVWYDEMIRDGIKEFDENGNDSEFSVRASEVLTEAHHELEALLDPHLLTDEQAGTGVFVTGLNDD
jgi:hypothetical protein